MIGPRANRLTQTRISLQLRLIHQTDLQTEPCRAYSAPSTLPPHQQSLVDGAYLLEKRLLIMLNANELTKIPPVTLSYTPPPTLKKRNKKTDKAEQTMALAK